MNKNIFLKQLESELKERSVENIEDIMSDYEDYIFQKIKEGKSEEEVLSDLGSLQDLADSYGEKKVESDSTDETETFEISLENISKIDVKAINLVINKGSDEKLYATHPVKYSIDGDTLTLESKDNKKYKKSNQITIVTNKVLEELDLETVNVKMLSMNIKKLYIKTVNLTIGVSSCKTEIDILDVKCVNADGYADNIKVKSFDIATTNGKFRFKGVEFEDFNVQSTLCKISFDDAVIDTIGMKENIFPTLHLSNSDVKTVKWGIRKKALKIDDNSTVGKII